MPNLRQKFLTPVVVIVEANLDVAVIMGWVHPIPIHEYIVGGYGYASHQSSQILIPQ